MTQAQWRKAWHALLFWLGTMALLVVVSIASHELPLPWQVVINGAGGAVLAWGLSRLFLRWDRLAPTDARLVPYARSLARLLCGLVAGAALACLFVGLLWLSGLVEFRPATSPDVASSLALVAAGFLLLATREEIAFRGYLLHTLETGFGRWPALLAMAVLFAIEHALSGGSLANVVLGAVPGALVFGMAALASRSLAFPIGLHGAWNMVDWATGGKGGAGLWQRVVATGAEDHVQAAALLLYVVVMGLALIALSRFAARAAKGAGDAN